jgi:hypothetical protein
MEKNKKLLKIIFALILLCYFQQIAYTQSIEETVQMKSDNYYKTELKKLADKYNRELQGFETNGVVMRRCYAQGKTLIWQYDVPPDWYPLENGKSNIIANFKKDGNSNLYFQNGINVEFQYFKNNKLYHKFHIDSNEFATGRLGDFISIKGHPKSLGVDMQLKVPENWKVEEGDRPHVVKRISYSTNSYMYNAFTITITENIMFVSRNEARELFADSKTVSEMVEGLIVELFNNPKIHNHKVITIDKYPALEFTVSGKKERAGINMSLKFRCWYVFYEDKIVVFQAGSFDNGEFERLEPFYLKIINSVIFPEQYER